MTQATESMRSQERAEPPRSGDRGGGAPQIAVGHLALRMPAGLRAVLQSDSAPPSPATDFIESSPDRTIYHRPAYVSFGRRLNRGGDIAVLVRAGQPQVGLPLHPSGPCGLSTGYSGVLFPPDGSEAKLKSAVAALRAFLETNRQVEFRCLQSVQAPSYDDLPRTGMVDCLLAESGFEREDIFSRIVRLDANAARGDATFDAHGGYFEDRGRAGWVENGLLAIYDGDVRNQIRQAAKRGLVLRYYVMDAGVTPAVAESAYGLYEEIHAESWRRTGLAPHPVSYWLGLSEAIRGGGGIDLMVLALNATARPIAAVTCHLYGARAIYWSAGSTAEGKENRANPFCLHGAISLSAGLGARIFELGRFTAGERNEKEKAITRYKAQFRGELVRVLNFRRPGRGAARHLLRIRAVLRRRLGGEPRG